MRRGRFAAAALLAAALLPASCGPKERVFRIAVAVPLTGDLGTEGQGLRRAVELAVEEANAAKRFPFRLETDLFDDRADPEEAANVANLIISDPRIVAVVGHYNSDCAIRAARVYAAAPIAMVTPAATTPEVTLQQLKPDWQGPRIVFRICPTDDVQGAFTASFVYRRLRKRRIAVIHDRTSYGQGLAEQFARTFAELGGKIVGEDSVSAGTKDFRPLLARVKAMNPQAVYFGGVYTEAGLFVKQMREAGMASTLFLSGDGAKTPAFFDVAGDAADGAYLATMGVPVEVSPAAKPFLESYRRRWSDSGEAIRPYDPFGYEAAQIILDALEKSGPDRRRVLAALPRTRHRGLLGDTSFDEKGDNRNKVITMTRADARSRTFQVLH